MSTQLQEAPRTCAEAPRTEERGPMRRARRLLDRFPSAWRGMLSLLDQGVVSATSFATAIIINRTCAPDEVGLYYLSLTTVLLTLGVHEHIIAAPYTIYSRRFHGAERAAYAGSAWVHHGVATIAVVALLGAVIATLTASGGAAILPALYALLAAGPLLLLREWIRRFTFADMNFHSALAIDASVAVVQLGGLAVLAYSGRLTLAGIYLTMGIACGLASLGWYLRRPRTTVFQRSRYWSDWKHNWAFGRWALRSYLVHNCVPYAMIWVVGAAASTESAGMLGACTTLIGVTTLLLTGFDRFLTPRAAQAYVESGSPALRRVLLQAAVLLVSALLPLLLLVAGSGSWLAVIAYGQGYEAAGPILITLAAASVTTALEMVAGIGLWSVDRPRANFLADLCSALVTIVAALLLVSPLGAWGAALATLAGSTAAAFARWVTLLHVLKSEPTLAKSPHGVPTCP